MDLLIRWHPTRAGWSPDRAYHTYEHVEAVTCDGHFVTLVLQHDSYHLPLSWIAEFQLFNEDV